MTRFARAKGSKASNEKLPNEATPWHLMKQQLEESKTKEPPEKKKSAKELLMERQDSDTVKNSSYEWADFDGNKSENLKTKYKKYKSHKSVTENCKNNDTAHNTTTKNNYLEKLEKTDKNIKKTEKKNKTYDNEQPNINTDAHSESNNAIAKNNSIEKLGKTNKNIRKTEKKNRSDKKQPNINTDTHSESINKELNIPQNASSNFAVLSKRQKRNLKRKLEKSNNDDSKRFKKDMSNENSQSKIKEKKIKSNGEYKRRKPDTTSIQTIIINGVETEIVKFDGFPIIKKDAERLTKLNQELLMKGKYITLYTSFCMH